MILNRKVELTMADIDPAADDAADIVDNVGLTRDETLILKEFAGELLAKREAQRVRDERNAHIRAYNSRGGAAAYKPPEPVAPAPPPPAPRRIMAYRQGDAGSHVFLPVYADD